MVVKKSRNRHETSFVQHAGPRYAARVDDRETRMRIGAKIARARKEHGLTQEDFAKLLGVTVRSLQNYESGAVVPYRHFRQMELVTNKRSGWFLHNEQADGTAAVHAMAELREQMSDHFAQLEERLRMLSENVERLRELRETSSRYRDARPAPVVQRAVESRGGVPDGDRARDDGSRPPKPRRKRR
jgi:transcriptional regulator with XRE-family HTH domain